MSTYIYKASLERYGNLADDWQPMDMEVIRMSPQNGHEDNEGAGAPLLWRQGEGVGAVQSGEDEALGRN